MKERWHSSLQQASPRWPEPEQRSDRSVNRSETCLNHYWIGSFYTFYTLLSSNIHVAWCYHGRLVRSLACNVVALAYSCLQLHTCLLVQCADTRPRSVECCSWNPILTLTESYRRSLVVHYKIEIKVEAANIYIYIYTGCSTMFELILAKPENAAVWFQLWGSRMAAKRFWPHDLQPIAPCNRLNTRIHASLQNHSGL